jgi:hypothetical protein
MLLFLANPSEQAMNACPPLRFLKLLVDDR